MTLRAEQIQVYLKDQTKPVEVSFDVPNLSSDGGFLLLGQLDDKLGICQRVAALLPDERDQGKVRHPRLEQVRQRLFQIAQGYEDCNDADRLRHDPLLKIVCGKNPRLDEALSSQPTLSRLENAVNAWDLYDLLIDFENSYVESLDPKTQAIILDADTSDDPTHGQQQLTFFNGYYGHYMYYPLFIFDQYGRLVSAILKPGNIHASKRTGHVLERIIRKIRHKCPDAAILVRADSAFSSPQIHERLEKLEQELLNVDYLLGQKSNQRLKKLAEPFLRDSKMECERTGEKVRECFEFEYAADSWLCERRIILKAEHTTKGANPRYVVTSLRGGEPMIWYDAYSQRGQAENHIKALMNAMFADRLSCSSFVANAFRLLLHGWAYRLMWGLREEVRDELLAELNQDEPAKRTEEAGLWQFDTMRNRLMKVAVIVKETSRRIWAKMPEFFPTAWLFGRLLQRGEVALVGT